MVGVLEVMSFEQVAEVIARVLDLYEVPRENGKVDDLSDDVEGGDYLRIGFELGIDMGKYESGGRISDEGQKRLREVAESYPANDLRRDVFNGLDRIRDARVFAGKTTILDWQAMQNFEAGEAYATEHSVEART